VGREAVKRAGNQQQLCPAQRSSILAKETHMRSIPRLIGLLLATALLAVACSSDPAQTTVSATPPEPTEAPATQPEEDAAMDDAAMDDSADDAAMDDSAMDDSADIRTQNVPAWCTCSREP